MKKILLFAMLLVSTMACNNKSTLKSPTDVDSTNVTDTVVVDTTVYSDSI